MPSAHLRAIATAKVLLRNYVRRHRYSATADSVPMSHYVYGECWDMAYELGLEIRHLGLGLRVRLAHGVGLEIPLGRSPDPRWGKPGQAVAQAETVHHYAVECHGAVLDPSAAQFGFRASGSLAAFRKRWRSVTLQSWLEVEAVAHAVSRPGAGGP